jgi:hypothetical protein
VCRTRDICHASVNKRPFNISKHKPAKSKEPRQRSRYSDWLRAGRMRGRSSNPCKVKNFLFSASSRPALEPTQPPIQTVLGAFSLGVKRPGREAGHSAPTSTDLKKMWIYTSTPLYLDSVVGIATCYGLKNRGVGVRLPVGVKNFPLSTSFTPVVEPTQPPIQSVRGGSFSGGKAAGA